jgi:hypothetical protein
MRAFVEASAEGSLPAAVGCATHIRVTAERMSNEPSFVGCGAILITYVPDSAHRSFRHSRSSLIPDAHGARFTVFSEDLRRRLG